MIMMGQDRLQVSGRDVPPQLLHVALLPAVRDDDYLRPSLFVHEPLRNRDGYAEECWIWILDFGFGFGFGYFGFRFGYIGLGIWTFGFWIWIWVSVWV